MKILIIDDDFDLCSVVVMFLEQLKYNCCSVSSVEDALKVLHNFDLVVVDSFNGKEFILAKACKHENVFCIYHTGKMDITDEEHCLFDEVVIKPGLDYLIRVINKLNKGETNG